MILKFLLNCPRSKFGVLCVFRHIIQPNLKEGLAIPLTKGRYKNLPFGEINKVFSKSPHLS